ncbi:alkaline phosphatase family protein [Sphingomonas sp. DT-204]|uniref:alkaline phosphatase family protein n=1 Tax=Sphingomonas sp. DT-204 TaxID=3396166 RepID=UPI003F1BE463
MTDGNARPTAAVPTRRRFLGSAATAMMAAALPPNLQKVLAAPPPSSQPSVRDIKHVVLLMQENRSFDHYFGTMSGVMGFSDPNAIMLPTGRSVFHQPTDLTSDGYMLPFRLDSRKTSAQRTVSTGHGWVVQHASWNHGTMDSWLTAHAKYDRHKENVPYVMGYYDEADLPFHRALANAFTICDRYHCSMMGPTSPNRIYWETGTIDPNGEKGGPLLTNEVAIRRWRAYAEELTDAGVSWKHYRVEGGMRSSTLYFQSFMQADSRSPLFLNSQVGPADQFEVDARNDRLPTVSWLYPGPGQNEHPASATPAAGARFIASKLDAIAANPEVWAKTVFVIVYDENDGLFDHVPPPVPPAGTPDEFPTKRSPKGIDPAGWPIGAGFRVPCIIVSPWTVGGWVCSEPFDHTSNLRLLELVTGVKAPNISAWRRDTFGDFTSALRFDQPAARPPKLPDTSVALDMVERAVATQSPVVFPTSHQVTPEQAPGKRPSVPREGDAGVRR